MEAEKKTKMSALKQLEQKLLITSWFLASLDVITMKSNGDCFGFERLRQHHVVSLFYETLVKAKLLDMCRTLSFQQIASRKKKLSAV
jgi:hypothetical protein